MIGGLSSDQLADGSAMYNDFIAEEKVEEQKFKDELNNLELKFNTYKSTAMSLNSGHLLG